MKPKPTFSWDELDAIHAAAGMADDAMPSTAFGATQYMQHYGISYPQAEGRLAKLVTLGKLKSGRKRAPHVDGKLGWKRFYWTL